MRDKGSAATHANQAPPEHKLVSELEKEKMHLFECMRMRMCCLLSVHACAHVCLMAGQYIAICASIKFKSIDPLLMK
jgi:hypothetical protein